jgi:hypothetical protein
LICVAFAHSIRAGDADIDQLKRLYDYDVTQPLDVQQKLIQDRDGVQVYDLTYASPKGGRPAMDRYAAAAPAAKTVKWYDTGHELNDPQALRDRAEWLRERVGLSPVEGRPVP